MNEVLREFFKDEIKANEEQAMKKGIEQGIEQGREQSNRQSALRMIKAGKLSNDEIALYSGLTTEQVEALEEMFQGNGDTF